MGRAQRRREREQRERLAQLDQRGLGPHADSSLEEESLSLRHMAASGLTPDGNLERLGLEADMANTPGWRGRRVLQVFAVLMLAFFAFSLARSLWGLFS